MLSVYQEIPNPEDVVLFYSSLNLEWVKIRINGISHMPDTVKIYAEWVDGIHHCVLDLKYTKLVNLTRLDDMIWNLNEI